MTSESNSSALSHDAARDAGTSAVATIDSSTVANLAKAATAAAVVGVTAKNIADASKDGTAAVTPKTTIIDPTSKSQETAGAETEKLPEKKQHTGLLAPLGRWWDKQVDVIRDKTSASIINNGSRINFSLKTIADSMSIASGFRKGSVSYWRAGANIITTATLIPGALYKEQPVSAEQDAKYDKMNAVQYTWTKVKEALDPKHHIVETVAMATLLNGIGTTMAGITQTSWKRGMSIKSVSPEIMQGALTTVAASILGFMRDRERAWQLSTTVFLYRIPFTAGQAWKAYKHGNPEKNIAKGDPYLLIKFGIQQVSNVFGMLFAGVKKLPDGRIVRLGKDDQDESIREAAKDTLKSKKDRKAEEIAEVAAANIIDPTPTDEETKASLKAAAKNVGEGRVLKALINHSDAKHDHSEKVTGIEDFPQEATSRQLASDALKSNALDSRLGKQGLSHAERAEQSHAEAVPALGA